MNPKNQPTRKLKMTTAEGIRLQKFLAQAGVGSRRHCEQLMERGHVSVNGEPAVQMGMRIDPATDIVHVDGVRIVAETNKRYLLFNKPVGVVCSMNDDQGRRDLSQYVAEHSERLYHVGRLDTDTSGLLLFTNDGELAHRMMHPGFEIEKTYVALVKGTLKSVKLKQLLTGIELEDGSAIADKARILTTHDDSTLVELTIHMGRNRIVRRMFDHLGHPVIELSRTGFGPLRLGKLGIGSIRELKQNELGALLDKVGL